MKQTMRQNKSAMASWLWTGPLKFAVITFAALIAIIFATEIIAGAFTLEHTYAIYTVLITMAMAGAAAVMIRGLPRTDLTRTSFVATINAQTIILSVIFVTTMLFFAANADMITMRMLMMSHHSGTFALCVSCAVIFFLYVTGLSFSALYAKFRRSRAIGIPAWKIICSIPFGFSMTWVPGYLMPDASDAKPDGNMGPYARMTHFIVTHPVATVASFTAMALLSGLAFGINMSLLTLASAMVMYIWIMRTGANDFKQHIAHTYSTCAVVANIAMLVMFAIAGTASVTPSAAPSPAAPAGIINTSVGE